MVRSRPCWNGPTRSAILACAPMPTRQPMRRPRAIFAAEGIGLCRTEHMFFEGDRLGVMREMIFAESSKDRRAVLDRLLPMQRADFAELFSIMEGRSVCVRLFDPPLHEFLPSDKAGIA